MLDFHLLKNAFTEEGIFLMLITVENTICHVSTMASFFVQTDTNTPISNTYFCPRRWPPWQVSIVFKKSQKGNGALLPLLQKKAF